jgi:uncharacterized protein (DUF1800 family)
MCPQGIRDADLKIDTVIAANRFGLGARPGDLSGIDVDPRGWLLDQLNSPPQPSAAIRRLPDSADIIVEVSEVRRRQRDNRKAAADGGRAPDIVMKFGAVLRKHYLQQTDARFKSAAETDDPFHERLVHFWSNHFAVSADKQPLTALAGAFENEAIRPNLNGHFFDLLKAAEQHAAMILYLDNQRSIGPNSELAKIAQRRRRPRQVGLNENLAREILELHTLGVGGGYSQADVTTFAAIISGWSLGGGDNPRLAEGTPGKFEFRDNIHEPGAHTVLGKRYAEGGLAQGEAVLRDLAQHASTATFIATKLCRHFVADEPPADVVERVASVFRETDGHLPSVHAAVVEADAPWIAAHGKLKTPQEFVVSAFRAFDRVPEDGRFVVGALDQMGQTPFRPGSPAGWPDTADHWGGADALYKRIEWSNTVARLAASAVSPVALGEAVLGPSLGEHSRTSIARAESSTQGVTLLLMSPEFQRR